MELQAAPHEAVVYMTKQTDSCSITERDRPAITPAMLEAGYRALVASGLVDDPDPADKLVLAEIFQAMADAEHTAQATCAVR